MLARLQTQFRQKDIQKYFYKEVSLLRAMLALENEPLLWHEQLQLLEDSVLDYHHTLSSMF